MADPLLRPVNHNSAEPREPGLPPYQTVLAETDWGSLRTALEAWGYEATGSEPSQEEPRDCGPRSDGRGDLVPPF